MVHRLLLYRRRALRCCRRCGALKCRATLPSRSIHLATALPGAWLAGSWLLAHAQVTVSSRFAIYGDPKGALAVLTKLVWENMKTRCATSRQRLLSRLTT
eukprot:COSAG01_NODE_39205_length_479_cov_1.955263_1_plen_99_part_01